ncbi:hypothetical protein FFLO_04857 [Filobasidium floriforme]|uniref:Uncharacterized protein n=1 Tax=Filobasidium floriforme TaxID=5210 RepID=A0A8K0NLZ1_9TREE|nr:uncharacterized protein HD553DRAFT_365697 [Filobasidium floriforme]KAG7530687.1 hypothetical protein FFLO_04857 [Filobasidium floriforme]KAH8077812.1 hypothetical protein HD553DRAFT_365697 [Filobasidium floriforme]
MDQVTGALNEAFALGKNKLGKPDTEKLSGEHAYQDPVTKQWYTVPAGSSASVVSTQSGWSYPQSSSGHSQQFGAPMTPTGIHGQWPDGSSGSSSYLAPGPSAAPYGTSPVDQWSGAPNSSSVYPALTAPIAPYGTPPVNQAPSSYGGQSPPVHSHEPPPYSYAPSTAPTHHSVSQGSYDSNAFQGQQYITHQPLQFDWQGQSQTPLSNTNLSERLWGEVPLEGQPAPTQSPFHQDGNGQGSQGYPPNQAQQGAQGFPPVQNVQWGQPPPSAQFGQYDQPPPPPAGPASQQNPQPGYWGNGSY